MTTILPSSVAFNSDGLVPAIIQDSTSRRVLMLGYMNLDSLTLTVETGRVVFWSRSRQELWRKGDTSGHFQLVRSIEVDCDSDALLINVEQIGSACHNGTNSCFDTSNLDAKTNLTIESVS